MLVASVTGVDNWNLATSAANLAAPSIGWRITITSLYCSTVFIVSAKLSPFLTLVLEAEEKPMTEPPRRCIALSKLNLVLVDGSKKSVARIFPRA